MKTTRLQQPRPGEGRILVVAPRGKNATLIHSILSRAGFMTTECERVEAISRASLDDVGVFIVAEEAFTRNSLDQLASTLSNQPAWSEVPVLVITAGGRTTRGSAMIAEALGARDNVTLLERPVRILTLVSAVRAAMRTRRRQYELRDLIGREQSARAQAEAASQAKDHFLAALSHELRTPLTPVLMSVAAMAADPAVPEPLRVELDMVKRNVELESKLIDDLLDLTRITNGKLVIQPTAVDVHSLLNHTIQSCWESAGSTHVTLVKDYRAGSHFVSGDSARLSQIFWNLLKNAIKFTPDGGRIRVATENDSEGRLVVAVTDTGIGIEPELLPRIFDAFEQLSGDITRRYGGLGLGLAISKALVDLHGGTIDAQSKGRNMGATLTVTLNTVPAPDEAIASQDHATARINGRPLRVLLVEDHEMTARVASRLLRSMSYEVETAADVASALELAQSHPFDVIISDLGLPDGSGVDLLRKIRVESSVPAIAMSGYGMESDIRQTREAGFNEHLVKPLDFSKLQSAIHRVVNDARSKRSNQSAACSTLSAEL